MHIASGKRNEVLLFCLVFFFSIAQPGTSSAQIQYGDPSYINDSKHPVKFGFGAGITGREEIKLKPTPMTVQSSGGQTLTFDLAPQQQELQSIQMYLTGSMRLGQTVELSAIVGQTKIREPLNADYALLGGAGLRISPPQTGMFKMGLLLQASFSSGKGTAVKESISSNSHTASGDYVIFGASGTGQEKMSLERYDALLGFGVDRIPHVRPYAGLLMSRIQGTDEVTFQGAGGVCVIPSGGSSCTFQSVTQTQFSVKRDIEERNSVGGIVGIILNPADNVNIILEGQFATSYSFSLSTVMSF